MVKEQKTEETEEQEVDIAKVIAEINETIKHMDESLEKMATSIEFSSVKDML